MHPKIPKEMLGRLIELPYEAATKAHAKEPETLGLHRMLGFPDQLPGRSVTFYDNGGNYTVAVRDWERDVPLDIDQTQVLAAASYLQGHVLTGTLKRIKSLGELEHSVVSGVLTDAGRRIMNFMDGDDNPWPWAGVGIVPMSPDGEEFALARKDHLHPRAGYCNRLALIGGGMDPNEILSDWGDEAECAYVAMLRETFEEIRVVDIAREIAESVKSFPGAANVRCYLYEDSGQRTDGVIRVFAARAPSADAWDRWRKIFTKEIDGLGEANPELVTRSALIDMIKVDEANAVMRERFLRDTPTDEVAAAEKEYRIFSRRHAPNPDAWKATREAAARRGEFPLAHRGDFAFISGIHAALRHLLASEGIY